MENPMVVKSGAQKKLHPLILLAVLCGLSIMAINFFTLTPRNFAYQIAREITRERLLRDFSQWEVLTGKNFEIYYREEDAAAGTIVLETAAAIYRPVVDIIGFEPVQATAIIVHPTSQGMVDSLGHSSLNEGAMGVYWAGVIQIISPSSWLYSEDTQQQARMFLENGPVTHEFAHVLVDYKARGNYPRWLSEGIAQYAEHKLHGVLWLGSAASFEQTLYTLEELDKFNQLANQNLAYRQAFSLVLYLVESYGEDRLPLLLAKLGGGANFSAALARVYGISPDELERDWLDWIAQEPQRWY
jgi:hypothetical protein